MASGDTTSQEVSEILRAERPDLERLLPLVYEKLKAIAARRMAGERGLSVVSGLCYRYQNAKRETIKRLHDGAIGDFTAMQCTYNANGLWHRGRQPEWSEMEFQMRNWLYFTWLSGDHIAEQHIHSLDKLAWAMGDRYPVKCTSSGGRIVRTRHRGLLRHRRRDRRGRIARRRRRRFGRCRPVGRQPLRPRRREHVGPAFAGPGLRRPPQAGRAHRPCRQGEFPFARLPIGNRCL